MIKYVRDAKIGEVFRDLKIVFKADDDEIAYARRRGSEGFVCLEYDQIWHIDDQPEDFWTRKLSYDLRDIEREINWMDTQPKRDKDPDLFLRYLTSDLRRYRLLRVRKRILADIQSMLQYV